MSHHKTPRAGADELANIVAGLVARLEAADSIESIDSALDSAAAFAGMLGMENVPVAALLPEPDRPVTRSGAIRCFVDRGMPAELAGPFLDAAVRMVRLEHDAKRQRIREAFAHALHLLETLGEDDPRTLAAAIKAVELQAPGTVARGAEACGIRLPRPTHFTDDGAPLYSVEGVAEALGLSPEQVAADVEELAGVTDFLAPEEAHPVQ
ncbi:hypothetical protein [Rubrivivax gelatinosus]|uniref:Uncharacterized protein n=1 Tax=Rubrivivax gelatinosus (strain NBRC 100245 / IL144) TaxID=983917 RepID=I0HT33_RUBGI|nr:hypothetical protein [Rubrivivax gelatinosus]BAL96170.1 hypothetical protein RGE_28310 [Rubrivivax gelatinosus IL144]